MRAIAIIFPQIFFALRRLGNITWIFLSFSRSMFSHVTRYDQSRASGKYLMDGRNGYFNTTPLKYHNCLYKISFIKRGAMFWMAKSRPHRISNTDIAGKIGFPKHSKSPKLLTISEKNEIFAYKIEDCRGARNQAEIQFQTFIWKLYCDPRKV